MASPASAKQQIIDGLKDVTNVLVTVSKDPSVDELSAAMGLTIFLNKLGKHATAVASGVMPPAISFLEPDKTFEGSANSLRDFIIALDKEKADHLRYKLEGDVVKIFITPYRTTITSDDLEFSQGDYNVEMVVGLNVVNAEDMDNALASHGKILHDATVATITSGDVKSSLGTIDWHVNETSGVSELVADLLGSLKTAKVALDEQISTALLTGIVAATDRFSNDLTSSKVMTAAAELMASGANQQLIVSNLQEAADSEDSDQDDQGGSSDGSVSMTDGETTKLSDIEAKAEKTAKPKSDDGVMTINHKKHDLDEVARQVAEDYQEDAAKEAERKLNLIEKKTTDKVLNALTVETPKTEEQPETQENKAPVLQPPVNPPVDINEELRRETEAVVGPSTINGMSYEPISPSIGGTLNATTDQAAADKQRESLKDQNRTILSHTSSFGSQSSSSFTSSPLNASMMPSDEPPLVDVLAKTPELPPVQTPAPVTQPHQGELLSAAMSAADQAPQTQAIAEPAVASSSPTLADIEAQSASARQPELSLPPMPPMPDFSSLPPLPPAPIGVQLDQMPTVSTMPTAPQATNNNNGFNPAQFQIPGQ